MKLRWTLLSTLTLVLLSAAPALAAVVAVMPAQGANLTEGQCDAIGVLFANAFAREANVLVATPMETKPVLAGTRTSLAAAARLGVIEYIEITAVQLGNKTTLGAIRFSKEGREVFRSETTAMGLDDMQSAVSRLARSLAWQQPVPRGPGAVADTVPLPEGPKHYPAALGIKSGIYFPVAKGRSFASMMSLQFDARVGTRDAFAEVGAGFAVPANAGRTGIQMGGVYAEFGGGFYLSQGSIAPYLGGGVSPRIWVVDTSDGDYSTGATTGATCTVHAQAGVNFTRDNRARIYGEMRVAQYIIGLSNEYWTPDGVMNTSSYYPTEFSMHLGIGW
jgi:hypothetical protein